MPTRLLSSRERERLSCFPDIISRDDLAAYFTLTEGDLALTHELRGDHNRLGLAVQLAALRYLGFVPSDVGLDAFEAVPEEAARYLAEQLATEPEALQAYGQRPKTLHEHLMRVMDHLGFRRPSGDDHARIEAWLTERALEHDRPQVLIEAVCEKMRREQLVRPGLTVVERMVATARERAHPVSLRRLQPILTPDVRQMLDGLLEPGLPGEQTALTWLRRHATTNSPASLLGVLERLTWLHEQGAGTWDLSALTPNRLRHLARLGRKYTNQALQRMGPERRYPILLALLKQLVTDTIDEAIDIFDACLAGAHRRSKRALSEHSQRVRRATEEKVRFFYQLGRLVMDPAVDDAELRREIYRRIPPLQLSAAIEEAGAIMRPEGIGYFDFLGHRYSYVRQFAPAFLQAMPLKATGPGDAVMQGVELLRTLNQAGRRKVPPDAPTAFVPRKWRPYVFSGAGSRTGEDPHGNGRRGINRRAWELCLLSELRGRLRSGDVYVASSRRYADPQSYLIPRRAWPRLRPEVCEQLGLSSGGQERLTERTRELKTLLRQLDGLLAPAGQSAGEVRIEQGQLVVPAFEAADRPDGLRTLERAVSGRLPELSLPDLLIETGARTGFAKHFTHAGGLKPKTPEMMPYLYASLLAQGCNMDLREMARSADLSYDQLLWTTKWYVREETLKAATATLVDAHYRQPLARLWGSGTLSSSDGQRFPVRGKVRNAAALPRYFGYGRGITFYTWSSDQYSQYGTKVISSTVRDATYILDEILDNETELTILEHTSDEAGYTDLVFGLFDLLGMRFCPRIRDLGDTTLYRLRDDFERYPHLEAQLTGQVDLGRLQRHFDELLRVAGSLKLGYVTASLLISKLQAYARQNRLTRLLKEHGRLVKTIHVLRCLESEAYRRRIGAQLNKGEKLHALRSWLMFGGDGKIRRKQEEAQTCQAGCLNLMTNAVILWNTIYMQAALDQLTEEGTQATGEQKSHLSPARFRHVGRYGKYRFDVEEQRAWGRALRPLRRP